MPLLFDTPRGTTSSMSECISTMWARPFVISNKWVRNTEELLVVRRKANFYKNQNDKFIKHEEEFTTWIICFTCLIQAVRLLIHLVAHGGNCTIGLWAHHPTIAKNNEKQKNFQKFRNNDSHKMNKSAHMRSMIVNSVHAGTNHARNNCVSCMDCLVKL